MLAVCLAALVMLPLALNTGRNVPPFLLAVVPAIATLWPSSWRRERRPARERAAFNLAIIGIASAATITAVVFAYATPMTRLKWTPLPQRSLDALAGCRGALYNRYDEGGYLIWFARGTRVFMDSRQDPYPPALVKEHIEVERTGSYQDMFQRYAVTCAYLPADSLLTRRLLAGGWTRLYEDRNWAVLSR
jgi:hypothetical protein